jgi:hypothetical protein
MAAAGSDVVWVDYGVEGIEMVPSRDLPTRKSVGGPNASVNRATELVEGGWR